jgi:hypothetical protein
MTDTVQNTVFVTVGGRDQQIPLERLGLTMASSESEVLAAVQGIIEENLNDSDGVPSFAVQKSTSNSNIFVVPKAPAG